MLALSGCRVEISEFLVEGLVHITDLPGDFYEFDEKLYTLTGSESGETLRIGQKVRVKVVRAAPEEGVVDLLLIEKLEETDTLPAAGKKTRPARGRKETAPKNSRAKSGRRQGNRRNQTNGKLKKTSRNRTKEKKK